MQTPQEIHDSMVSAIRHDTESRFIDEILRPWLEQQLNGEAASLRRPPLFGSWLEATRELQTQAYGKDPWRLIDEDGDEFIRFVTWNALATIAEVGELLDELHWKPWSTRFGDVPDPDERARAIGEVVDVLHFVGNILAALKCTDLELRFVYQEKMDKNRARIATGKYDARSDKCPGCKRALDDVGTRDGRCVACDAALVN